jgi:hypothetical protein
MSKLTELQTLANQKYLFNPKNKEHVFLLKQFLQSYKWGKPCPFLLEEPYVTIPDMIKDKYIKYQLGVE